MIKIEEIKKMSKQELETEIDESGKKLFKLKFEVTTGASKANNDISRLKKYIARMKTIKTETRLEEEKKFKSQKTV